MRILMLGWEFPPFIAGGLGTACYGLTRALDRLGNEVIFILPRQVGHSHAAHVRLLRPDEPARSIGDDSCQDLSPPSESRSEFRNVEFRSVAATFSSPYPDFAPGLAAVPPLPTDAQTRLPSVQLLAADTRATHPHMTLLAVPAGSGSYGGDLIGDSERYARLVVSLARRERFDAIHAHDWLTYPAGIALSRVTGKPLVVHVHSTEFDRSGENVHQPIYDIERRGMHAAQVVIAVSRLTKSICEQRYAVPAEKVEVVYNGIDDESRQPAPNARIASGDKIVLFLGRITMQKGPEYFVAAARRVLEKIDNVKFVVAGAGDMATRMIDLAAQFGIGHKLLFTGFLRGRDVERVFRMADCYVMPSVSEPFGLAALEAIQHDVPVIVSKQSGVSEVLTHVLKVDFWDVDEMANKIVAILRHPPLSQTLRQHGNFELRRLTWLGAAEKCVKCYERAVAAQAAG